MGYDFSHPPANNDFTAWKQPLLDQIDKYCSGELKFVRSSLQWGGDVLNSLSDDESTLRLYNYLDKEHPAGLKPWTNRQWWTIFILSLGIVALIWSIYLACVAGCKKTKISRVFAPFFSKQHAPDGKPEVNPKGLRAIKATSYFLVLMCLLFGILTYISNAQMIIGMKQSECNVWLHVYGHYFGGQNMTSGENVGGVAKNWQGTRPILDALEELGPNLKPGAENPLYNAFNQGRDGVGAAMQANTAKALATLATMYNTHSDYAAALSRTTSTLSNAYGVDMKYAIMDLGDPNLGIKLYELQATLMTLGQLGGTAITQLIESYVGPTSILLNKAYNSVHDAARIVEEVDVAVSHVASLWTKLSSVLRGAVVTSAALSIVATSLMIIATGWGLYLGRQVSTQLKSITGKVVRHRRTWLTLYTTLLVCGGVYFVLLGLDLVLGGVGAGICSIADQRLFSEGRWALLGDDVLKPMGDETSVDMIAVFDTCVKSTGHGEVSSVLGLDLRIQELQDDVDAALEHVEESRDTLLAERALDSHFKELDFLVDHMTRWIYTVPTGLLASYAGFRNTLSPQPTPLGDKSSDQTLFTMLSGYAMQDVLTNGFWFKLVDVAHVIDYLNKFADAANQQLADAAAVEFAALSEHDQKIRMRERNLQAAGQFPHWCATIATEQGSTCADDPDALTLDIEGFDRAAAVTAPIALAKNAAFADWVWEDNVGGLYGERLQGALDAVMFSIAIGTINTWPGIEFPEVFGCPNNNCLVPEMLANAGETLLAMSTDVRVTHADSQEKIAAFVNQLVIPQMHGLASVADGLTDNANCQYEGTALQEGVVATLCQVTFPGTAIASIFSLFGGVIAYLMAYIVRYWMHIAEVESQEYTDVGLEQGEYTEVDVEKAEPPTMPTTRQPLAAAVGFDAQPLAAAVTAPTPAAVIAATPEEQQEEEEEKN